ncbi:MAG: 30S ribosomal protein S1 [Pelagibacteraceae bacterium]|nr:30S ribosomal protein S1 [Pelagibacteraceae bacterium]PPR52163.1 MAG: 30S ribosomal protein S1 [Alphaproteobacteria bacterium MarineAlpha5_Bin10]|tara:strand:- start:41 stop:1744 length:1704 start_codon:yes stop_codon:yes gene_type:complete
MKLDNNKGQKEISNNEFGELIDSTFEIKRKYEKRIIEGNVISILKDSILVDVGLKSEGRIPISEFTRPGHEPEMRVGDKIEVYLDQLDDRNGEVRLSREKAIKQSSWENLQNSFTKGEKIVGIPFNRVKGGFSVDLDGVVAFLPGSQIDVKPIKDPRELLNKSLEMVILKMDKLRGNIVVSRKAIVEEERKEARDELISSIKEGSKIKGVVKNLTDYGAFIDLGGMDGLVHITDITWNKINHPSEFLKIGEEIETIVLKYTEDTKRLSLGIKQLESDPWEGVIDKYKVGNKYQGKVSSITDYGAFVLFEKNVEGLIANQDLSWTKKNIHASKLLEIDQSVEVQILDIDTNKRRVSLGLKQCKGNPWDEIKEKYKVGDVIESKIVNIVDFGVFVRISDEVDGMVHISDLSWNDNNEKILSSFEKGQDIKTKILEINAEKERISMGIKQLEENPNEKLRKSYPLDSMITVQVKSIQENGIEVQVAESIKGFIKKSNLAIEKGDQKLERFAVGEKVDVAVISYDEKDGALGLSIKRREVLEEKEAVSKFGSKDSGASLGDILGKVLGKKK